jgi:PIN domain nuclease of toxin-antitoxin system
VRYLLDTHAVIWYFEDSPELPKKLAEIIDDPNNSIYLCSASLWEIAIKMGLGKLNISLPLDELLKRIQNEEYTILQIEDEYLEKLLNLPLIHKDPFDRLLVSSALAEGLTIITIDENIRKYDVPWDW